MAEAFAWMNLRDVYTFYPEVEFFHLAKLLIFSQFRADDNHLLGAASMSPLFHSFERGTFNDLVDLATAPSWPGFLNSHALMTVDAGAVSAPYDLTIEFTPQDLTISANYNLQN